ncbi:hypothetical protein [Dyella monticola]|uniref:hypothetical protein n=1 Tax=Dyella monticola TaxID=1927958 RepID=UPI0013140D06|nr:hypothetical protein [Dyella monticola]
MSDIHRVDARAGAQVACPGAGIALTRQGEQRHACVASVDAITHRMGIERPRLRGVYS